MPTIATVPEAFDNGTRPAGQHGSAIHLTYVPDPPDAAKRDAFMYEVSAWCNDNLMNGDCAIVWTFQTLSDGERSFRAFTAATFTATAMMHRAPEVARYFIYDPATARGTANWLSASGSALDVYAPSGDLGHVIELLNHPWADPCTEEFLAELYAFSGPKLKLLRAILEGVDRLYAVPRPCPDGNRTSVNGPRDDLAWDALAGMTWSNLAPHLEVLGLWDLPEATQGYLAGLATKAPPGTCLDELLDLVAAAQA